MTRKDQTTEGIFGYFDTPEKILNAARATRERGFPHFDCFTPFPVEGLQSAMGLRRSDIPKAAFLFGIAGALFALILQTVALANLIPPGPDWLDSLPNLNAYPLEIAGRPSFSWPATIPVIFEFGVLAAALGAFLVFLMLTRLPRPQRSSIEMPEGGRILFALWIPLSNNQIDREDTIRFLSALGADSISCTVDATHQPKNTHSKQEGEQF